MEAERESEQARREAVSRLETHMEHVIEENNRVESEFIYNSIVSAFKNAPQTMNAVISHFEKSLYAGYPDTDAESTVQEIEKLQNSLERYADNIKHLENLVEEDRRHLKSIIDDIKEIRPEREAESSKITIIPSDNVEELARRYAAVIGSVDEDELIEMMNKGPETGSGASYEETITRYAQIKTKADLAKRMNKALRETLNVVENIEAAPEMEKNSADDLADTIMNSIDRLNFIENCGKVDATEQRAFEEIQDMLKRIEIKRQECISMVSNPLSFPVPNPALLEEANDLESTLYALQASSETLYEFLQSMHEKGIVEHKIFNREEAREIYDRLHADT